MATRGWSVSSDSSDDELPTLSKLVSTAAKAVVVLSDSSDGSERGDMLESRLPHASKNNTQTAEHCGNSKNAVRVKSKPQIQTSSLAERDTNGTYCRNKGKSKTAPLNKSEKRRKVEKPKPASVQPKARLLKPEECLEQVICCIDSKLNAMFEFETLFEKLRDFTELKAVNFEVMDADVLSVVWRRCSGQTTAGKISVAHNDGAGKNAVFVVLPAREYAKLVCAQEADDVYEVPPRKTCGEWVSDVTSLYKNCKIHAVCLGLQTYLREAKTKNKRRAQQNGNSKRVNSKRSTFMPVVSALEQDLAHAETQLLADIDWVFAETAADLCSVIAQYTKSFAQAPQKLLTENDRFVKDTEAVKVSEVSLGHVDGSYICDEIFLCFFCSVLFWVSAIKFSP